MGTLVDKFDEHEGPVRGINFHRTQPLFVSGGDDFKIKVWNYKLRRCLFTLLGHLDYIRTVQFHHESPWILSASDDQTIRLWNWQGRTCIAVLTGHNHYVMCAQFHPKEHLVVSASLDQTVRVWDINGLRRKGSQPSPQVATLSDEVKFPQLNNDLFGTNDAQVKYVLEGHDRGVNWACFHPQLPLIVSGSDDRYVKLWRMNETKAWEVDTFRGHYNNVSCVLFHPKMDLILSNAEDRSIRIWDISKRALAQTYRREHDRFWILAAHPTMNLFAAGHDSGMSVFKLERERPAFTVHAGVCYYVKDRYLRTFEYSSGRDVPVMSIRRGSGQSYPSNNPRSIEFNAAENHLLLQFSDRYELLSVIRPANSGSSVPAPTEIPSDPRRGRGDMAVFVARNRLASLFKSQNNICISDLQLESRKYINLPHAGSDMIFYAGTGMILVRSEEKLSLIDIQQSKPVAELACSNVKYISWSGNMAFVALICKHSIMIANRKLELLCSIHETIRVKGGEWDENNVFIYTTLNHIKYLLPFGDSGVIRTLDIPIYITRVQNSVIYCLDRELNRGSIPIDTTEYRFKLALHQQQFDEVVRLITHSRLTGQALIAYLEKKGFSEVALHFSKDDRTKFNLALECGNIEVAWDCAKRLDEKECWSKLASEALRQGNHQVVEMAYQRIKNFEGLSFLYLLTGNTENLGKMLKIAKMRGDVMSTFHNALFVGNVQERITLLQEAGHLSLAFGLAKSHGLTKEAAQIEELIKANHLAKNPATIVNEEGIEVPNPNQKPLPKLPVPKNAKLLFPPVPIVREANWPLLTVSKSIFDSAVIAGRSAPGAAKSSSSSKPAGAAATAAAAAASDIDMGAVGGAWGDDDADPLLEGTGEDGEAGEDAAGAGKEDGWETDPLDLGDVPLSSGAGGAGAAGANGSAALSAVEFVPPATGLSLPQKWTRTSQHPVVHIAAGSFETAMRLLNQQIGIVNFAPLKPVFMSIVLASQLSLQGLPSAPANTFYIQNAESSNDKKSSEPSLVLNLAVLVEKLKHGYKMTTEGKFSEALATFRSIIQLIPFIHVSNKQELNETMELLGICREYITGINIETLRKETKSEVRQCELAAYFTHCNMQPIHLVLALRSAMNVHFKAKNFATAASFAQRLLDLNSKPEITTLARKVMAACEQNKLTQANPDMRYNERNPFTVCNHSYVPIYKGQKHVVSPYCQATYLPEFKGQTCSVDLISEVGAEVSGIQIMGAK